MERAYRICWRRRVSRSSRIIAYIALVVAALALPASPAPALYLVSAVMVVLLFLGIHNSSDLVTYLAVERSHAAQ